MSLAVISAAIDLRISVEGTIGAGNDISVDLPDIGKKVEFNSDSINYEGRKDYIRSAVKVLRERGLIDDIKVDARITGNIPREAGTSSSSALSVAWIGFLLGSKFSMDEIDKMRSEIAELAYITEVEEFNESGGKQDQLASASGGVSYFTFFDEAKVEELVPELGSFVLGDSGEPKDTQKTLKRVREGQEAGLRELRSYYKFNKNSELEYEKASPYFSRISKSIRPYLEGVVENFKITKQAYVELKKNNIDNSVIADLMNRHHAILRDKLDVSTNKIENMIDRALNAGAMSAKINGSGEGGCMFAYCPGREEQVSDAILEAGGTPYIIKIGRGLKVKISE